MIPQLLSWLQPQTASPHGGCKGRRHHIHALLVKVIADALHVALEDATWGPSVGLWQIRSLRAERGTGKVRDVTRLKRPAFNARSMASISGKGKNFSPWSTYTSGAYKKHLAEASAISGVVVSSDTSGGVVRGPKPAAGAAQTVDWSPLPGDHGVPGYLDDLLLGAGGKAANAPSAPLVHSR